MVIGDAELWADTFPDYLVPRILDLVTDTWATFVKPLGSEHEVPITRRFKHALRQMKNYRKLPVRIERELAEDHPATGDELGRIDLKFMPAERLHDEVYFAFECKRLNVIAADGSTDSLAPEYVTEGMLRFVIGRYACAMQHGGMIAYVLDGKCTHAIQLVEKNIRKYCDVLRMNDSGRFERSKVRSADDAIRETTHNLESGRRFLLYHVFLGSTVN